MNPAQQELYSTAKQVNVSVKLQSSQHVHGLFSIEVYQSSCPAGMLHCYGMQSPLIGSSCVSVSKAALEVQPATVNLGEQSSVNVTLTMSLLSGSSELAIVSAIHQDSLSREFSVVVEHTEDSKS